MSSKLCRHCGIEFERMYAIFCSKKCSDAAGYINRKTGNTHLEERQCENCGSDFIQKKSTQFCCSKSCSSNLYRRNVSIDVKRKWRRKGNYGVTQEDWDLMFEEQSGLCKICREELKIESGRYAIDHCHSTGIVRGILCKECNLGIGYFKDRPDLLIEASKYLVSSTDDNLAHK